MHIPFELYVVFYPKLDHVFSRYLTRCLFQNYAYLCTWIGKHLKETLLRGNNTWSENEEQNIQAKKVLFIGFIGNKVIFIYRFHPFVVKKFNIFNVLFHSDNKFISNERSVTKTKRSIYFVIKANVGFLALTCNSDSRINYTKVVLNTFIVMKFYSSESTGINSSFLRWSF